MIGTPSRRRVGDLALGLGLALASAAATWRVLDLPATYVAWVLCLYVCAAALLLGLVPAEPSPRGIGTANRVTLVRLVGVLVLAGLVLHAGGLGQTGRWWVVGLGTVVMVLDGLDGWIARTTGTETGFGARFDMETDALLMLVLSALVWAEGRSGAWILLAGGMRYLFVAAGWLAPGLRVALFPSLRRKVVCVLLGVALLVALGPVVPDAIAVGVCAVALVSLTWSFGVDTIWLVEQREGAMPASRTDPTGRT